MSLGIGVSVLIVALREQNKRLEKAIVDESKLFAETMAKNIESGYLLYILPERPLREITSFGNILFFWIVKPDGEIYLADDPQMLGKKIEDSSLSSEEVVVKDSIYSENGKKIKLVIYPLKMGAGEKPWSLFMGVSLETIGAAQKRIIFISFALFSLLTIFIFVISFYLAKRITKPLRSLEEGVRIIGRGNLDYKLKIRSGDEVEELAESFNQMAENLKRYYKTIEESKDVLEVRVKARTREIRELAAGLEDKVKERTKGLMESRDALLNMLEDVNVAREKAEEEKNKTSAIITNFSDGLLVFDKENNLAFVNPQAENFLKVKEEKIIGKSIPKLLKISFLQPLMKILGEGIEKTFRKELEINENLILEVTTVPVIREKEKIGNLVILHDVTREKLVDKMKTEFVSLAAHQLRTPLSVIKWTLKMFLDGDLGKLNKEQQDFLDSTYKSNEKMIALINDLLNITRIEEGRYLYNLVSADIEGLVDSIINSHREEIKKKRIKVTLRKPSKKIPKTLLDVEKIKIAIDNIFDNAIKYTLPGGEVTVYLKYDKKNIEVSIEDTGVGISEKQQGRLFTKFFRGSNVIRMETEGTGLGLFIAKNIIEAHGGKIWFKSKEKVGTTFYFSLPIREKIPAGN